MGGSRLASTHLLIPLRLWLSHDNLVATWLSYGNLRQPTSDPKLWFGASFPVLALVTFDGHLFGLAVVLYFHHTAHDCLSVLPLSLEWGVEPLWACRPRCGQFLGFRG